MQETGGRRLAAATASVLVVAAGTLAAVAGATAASASGGAPVCSSGTCTVTLDSPGTGQSFTVPAGVSALSVTLYGGTGGTNYSGDAAGGDGAGVTASLATSPAAVLGVDVGGAGVGGADNGADYPGGINGGGGGVYSGSGGGATDVTSGGTDLLVAAGGGGGGADKEGSSVCIPGNDFLTGGAGGNADTGGAPGQGFASDGVTLNGGSGGLAGTTSGAGAGGLGGTKSGADPCPEGGLSTGHTGAGGSGNTGGSGVEATGGGGGGGYFGGGAGGGGANESSEEGALTAAYAGGGGGASYGGGSGVSGYSVTDTGNSGQVNGGNGEAVLSYADPLAGGAPAYQTPANQVLTVPAASGLLSSAAVTAPSGDTLTASGPPGGLTAQGGSVVVNADGSFSYTPPTGFTGGDSFPYTVTDASGDYATAVATIQVQPIPQMIAFTSSPPDPAPVGGTYTPAATGGGSVSPVTFGIDPASTAGACSISSGTVSFTGVGTCVIDANQAGGGGYSAAPQVSQMTMVGQSPAFVLDSPPLTATIGQVYGYTFAASGSPAPSYALAGAPSWLSIDASTGSVSGTPPSGTASFSYEVTATNAVGTVTAGPYEVTVSAHTPKANIAAALSCQSPLTKGDTGTCSLAVINYGPATAVNVSVAALLRARLSEVSCTGGCAPDGADTFVWQLSSLASGTSMDYTITVKALQKGTGLIVIDAASATSDPHPYNNVATRQITIKRS
jgi:hypothetical protein